MKNAFFHESATRTALAEFVAGVGQLSMGSKCREFEAAFAARQGRTQAVLFNSGGSANLAMFQAQKNLGRLKTGDRIGFSAVTWSTNVMPIMQLGFEAIPIDCDPTTLNSMSATALPALIKEKCRAFFLTNVLGLAGDLDLIKKECAAHKIILLEDNCEALGTALPAGTTGNFGLASSFSFFVAHHLSTIEGGMVSTDDREYADMLRIVRANGWDRNLSANRQKIWRKQSRVSDFEARYTFYDLGYNLRPTEITGFLGLNQLKSLDTVMTIREKNFKKIQAVMDSNADFLPLVWSHLSRVPAFAIPLVCRTSDLKKKYLKRFNRVGIETRPLIAGNLARQPFFLKYQKRTFKLPGADLIHDQAFYCGNCPDYTADEIHAIITCIDPVDA